MIIIYYYIYKKKIIFNILQLHYFGIFDEKYFLDEILLHIKINNSPNQF